MPEATEKLREAGRMMANVLYNVAQASYVPEQVRMIPMKEAQEAWDEAIAAWNRRTAREPVAAEREEEDPHENIHLYEGDSALVIRENGNKTMYGAARADLLAVMWGDGGPTGEVAELVERLNREAHETRRGGYYGAERVMREAAAALSIMGAEHARALKTADEHTKKIEALLEPYVSWDGKPSVFDAAESRISSLAGEVERLTKERDELHRKVYAPGVWKCAKCNFRLLQANLNAADGTVTVRDAPGDKCPNCEGPLWRVSWKDEANENLDIGEQQVARAVAAEARAEKAEDALAALSGQDTPSEAPLTDIQRSVLDGTFGVKSADPAATPSEAPDTEDAKMLKREAEEAHDA